MHIFNLAQILRVGHNSQRYNSLSPSMGNSEAICIKKVKDFVDISLFEVYQLICEHPITYPEKVVN